MVLAIKAVGEMFGSPSTTNGRRGSLRGPSGIVDFTPISMLRFALAGEYPQVMAEHAPAHGGDKTFKALEKTATQPKRAFQHRNSAFDARAKRLTKHHHLVGVVLQPRGDRQPTSSGKRSKRSCPALSTASRANAQSHSDGAGLNHPLISDMQTTH